jgi:hypothetical protein
MADNMDLDAAMAALDFPSSNTSTSSTKTSIFKPKLKGADAAPVKTTVKPKIEPKDAIPTSSVSTASSQVTHPKIEPDTNPNVEANAAVEEEDEVEREIDVFLSPFPLDENETEVIKYRYNFDLMPCQIMNPEFFIAKYIYFLKRTKGILEVHIICQT